jgi:hypothetical protein
LSQKEKRHQVGIGSQAHHCSGALRLRSAALAGAMARSRGRRAGENGQLKGAYFLINCAADTHMRRLIRDYYCGIHFLD